MYIVKKDGLYLTSYMNAGIMEYDSNGEYKNMLTGLYSADKRDAMLIDSPVIANNLGAELIPVKKEDIR